MVWECQGQWSLIAFLIRIFFKQTLYIFVKDLYILEIYLPSIKKFFFLENSVKSLLMKCRTELFHLCCWTNIYFTDHCFFCLTHFDNSVQRFCMCLCFQESENLYSDPGLSLICCITLPKSLDISRPTFPFFITHGVELKLSKLSFDNIIRY